MARIDTSPPAGTRDFGPADERLREHVFAQIREEFTRHGFNPMSTPAFERLDVLTGKYGDEGDSLIFKILRRGEHEASGDTDLALRYDLTVPLARFMASQIGTLPTPFKRYCISPVWRADRPAKGRFREFTQCDVDTVGATGIAADADVLRALTSTLGRLDIGSYTVRCNSRKALHGLVEAYGVPDAQSTDVLVAIDKLDKIGADGVTAELRDRGVADAAVTRLAEDLAAEDRTERIIAVMRDTAIGKEGVTEVEQLLDLLGDPRGGAAVFDPLLARGLSYYTGPIFEVAHDGLSSSIAAGGRYDGLVGMFSSQDIPATGGSIGVDRVLLAAESALADASLRRVVVTIFDEAGRPDAFAVAQTLRDAGIDTDVAVGEGKLGKQLKYADRVGARFAVIRGESERADGSVTLKDLASGEQSSVALEQLATTLSDQLGA